MAYRKDMLYIAALALLVCLSYVNPGSISNDALAASEKITTADNNGSSLPDFDGDGTIGFGDFVLFAGAFGSSQGDEKYDARYDLNGDGEIGFPDFVTFAQDFGKEVPPPVVSIPDVNLRAAIETALDKASGAPITLAEMATLDSLEASNADISDLTGLDSAVNLTWLDLSSNDIADISVLGGLPNLTHLNLSDNDISDLASLVANKGLGVGARVDVTDNPLNDVSENTHISVLRARGVAVAIDITPRFVTIPDDSLRTVIETILEKAAGTPITQADMATMDSLAANAKGIRDLTGLESAANLTYLSLYNNEIADISRLASLINLKELLLSHNRIKDISKLAGLTRLTELWLWDNQIEDISALSGLIFLTRLSLGENKINDISALSNLSNLNVLFLKGNDISDLAGLAANKGLGGGDIVDVTDNPLNATALSLHIPALQARGVSVSFVRSPEVVIRDTNLRAAVWRALDRSSGTLITVADMEILTHLLADKSGIDELTGLEAAANLTFLDVGENNIRDLSPLAGLTKLMDLDLRSNNIKDLAPLAGLTKLTHLDLFYNHASNLSSLAGLRSLTRLNLTSNNIKNLSPLAGLTKLMDLDLRSNAIRDLAPLAGLTNLTNLVLRYNNVRDLSPLAGLTNLTDLRLGYNNVRDLAPLAGLTNLTNLDLWSNNIENLSPLAGLTDIARLGLAGNYIADLRPLAGLADLTWLSLSSNPTTDLSPLERLTALESLQLKDNGISDLSVLAGLGNLTVLKLTDNRIADVSPLAGLTNLTWLELGINDLTDVSPLGGLVSLNVLELQFNRISDISALAVLTGLSRLDLRGNPLNDTSVDNHIPMIESRGATVSYDSFGKGDYDIELVFLDKLTERQRFVIQYAARRWMAVIRDDLPDYEFTEGWSASCVGRSFKVRAGEKIDDLRIYVWTIETGAHVWDGRAASGFGGPKLLRNDTHLPVVGCMGFDLKSIALLDVALHEIGHVLGFGTVWGDLDYLRYLGGDTHFDGPLATAAFDEAGGTNYQGEKVPVSHDGVHWRVPVLDGEIMASIPGVMSAITVQSLADLGYGVNVGQADEYILPDYHPGAKITVTRPTSADSGVDITRADDDFPHDGDPNARIDLVGAHTSIGGYDNWGRRLAHAEAVWRRGVDFGSGGFMARLAPPIGAEPELTCGAALEREPIYVVDPQGRVVRNIVR